MDKPFQGWRGSGQISNWHRMHIAVSETENCRQWAHMPGHVEKCGMLFVHVIAKTGVWESLFSFKHKLICQVLDFESCLVEGGKVLVS